MENFMIAAFRSRMHVMAFEHALRQRGVRASVVTTPRAVALGCGLSVRFAPPELERVRAALDPQAMSNLIGLYSVERDALNRTVVRPVHSRQGR